MSSSFFLPAKGSGGSLSAHLCSPVCLLFWLLFGCSAFAQDSLRVVREPRDTVLMEGPEETVVLEEKSDTVAIKSYARRFSPRKAILYAAILPGLGQVYNKKYWKLPLVYGGFYAIGHYIKQYNKLYTEYKGYLYYNLENGLSSANAENPDIGLTTSQLRTIVDKSRRERDFMIILMGGMYLLQMVDAHVDSHLKEFDVNPRLQVSIEPTVQQDIWTGRTTGVALIVRF